jgi:hypothetical protein
MREKDATEASSIIKELVVHRTKNDENEEGRGSTRL